MRRAGLSAGGSGGDDEEVGIDGVGGLGGADCKEEVGEEVVV